MPDNDPSGAIPPVEPMPARPPVPVVPPDPASVEPLAPVTPAERPRVDPYAPSPSYPAPPAAYPPGYYQPGYYQPAAAPRGLAIAAMVCGIVGVFFSFSYGLGLLPSIAGVITGHLALKRNPAGRGMAIAGLVCGYVGILLSLVVIVVAVVFIAIALNTTSNIDG